MNISAAFMNAKELAALSQSNKFLNLIMQKNLDNHPEKDKLIYSLLKKKLYNKCSDDEFYIESWDKLPPSKWPCIQMTHNQLEYIDNIENIEKDYEYIKENTQHFKYDENNNITEENIPIKNKIKYLQDALNKLNNKEIK